MSTHPIYLGSILMVYS